MHQLSGSMSSRLLQESSKDIVDAAIVFKNTYLKYLDGENALDDGKAFDMIEKIIKAASVDIRSPDLRECAYTADETCMKLEVHFDVWYNKPLYEVTLFKYNPYSFSQERMWYKYELYSQLKYDLHTFRDATLHFNDITTTL